MIFGISGSSSKRTARDSLLVCSSLNTDPRVVIGQTTTDEEEIEEEEAVQ